MLLGDVGVGAGVEVETKSEVLGACVGLWLGALVGLALGWRVGAGSPELVGLRVGDGDDDESCCSALARTLSLSLSPFNSLSRRSDEVGLCVGDESPGCDGCLVGLAEGAEVEADCGNVGLAEGCRVGSGSPDSVGLRVGLHEGAGRAGAGTSVGVRVGF